MTASADAAEVSPEEADATLLAAACAWAKSDPISDPANPTAWLPLWQHLDDAAAVAGYLWDEWLAPSVRRLIASGLPNGDTDGRTLVTWLAGIHDIGKVSPAFAIQVPRLCDRMIRSGYPGLGQFVHQDRSRLRHEIAGAIALDDWLDEKGLDENAAAPFLAVVGGHHGDFPSEQSIMNGSERGDLLGEGTWSAVRRLLLDRAAARHGVIDRLPAWRAGTVARPTQMAITGLVIMADWIASSAEYFPLLDIETVPVLPPADCDDSARVAAGLRRLDLSPPWNPAPGLQDAATRFRDRFPEVGADPRPVQTAAMEAARTMTVPGMMIVEAPMGEGKTEAALLAAEILAERTGATGCLLALPTQATSNAMFTRMLDWLHRLPDADARRASVALVHGKAALNDEYRDIRFPRNSRTDLESLTDGHQAESAGWRATTGPAGRDEIRRERPRLVAVVDEWMTGRKRAALSDFVVSTIDNVLFAALNARHIMLRQLALLGKVVVLDEVHAADVYMSRFLDRALEWLGAAGTPVILLSATLPPRRRAELYASYERGRRAAAGAIDGSGSTGPALARAAVRDADEAAADVDRLLGYPSIVATGAGGPIVTELEPSGRRTEVATHRLNDDADSLVALLRDRLAEGGCAVVIRNTVARVQETARMLSAEFPGEVTVAHAQFLASDRIENDRRLLAMFGKPGQSERPDRHIVVASQVVEQSLDVDFDLMVTDASPVDLILQRMGRLHRHARGAEESERPAAVRRPECWIAGVDWTERPPKPAQGSRAVYGSYPLLAALAVLDPYLDARAVRLPEDIAPLVAGAYGEFESPAGWDEALAQARKKDAENADERRARASGFLLGEPYAGSGSMLGAARGNVGVVDEEDPKGQACVRDGGDSIEVVVLQRSGEVDRVPDWVAELPGEPLPFRDQPVPPPVARALARCTLRLPFRLCVGPTFDRTIEDLEANYFPGWARTPFLSGALALVLDSDRTAELPTAGHCVRYDRDYGLIVTKTDTN